MASNLFTPILNDRTRAPNFFNGRLLTGEAMTDEQRANRVARELLAQAVGDGIAYGLEVESAPLVNTVDRPVVKVKSGVAINRRGEILLLASDTQVELVRPTEEAAQPTKIFRTCTPVSNGDYIADAGVYLLTISSIQAGNGLAQVSGLGDTPASCNIKYIVDAVELRLLQLPVANTLLSDVDHLRNAVAYDCFGVDDLLDFATDPFGTTTEPETLLDEIRDQDLTTCDVPLAILYWTASGGIQWIDRWAVRRRVTHTKASSTSATLSDVRRAASEAMVLQFQDHIDDLGDTGALSTTTHASSYFRYLPPAGLLPLPSGVLPGINYENFFVSAKVRGPAFVPDPKLIHLLTIAMQYPPIDLLSPEMFWLYFGVENMRRANEIGASTRVQGFVGFVNGHVEYAANARFDLSYWNYANYARI